MFIYTRLERNGASDDWTEAKNKSGSSIYL